MAPLRLISLHLLLGWIALVVNADFYDGSFSFLSACVFFFLLSNATRNGDDDLHFLLGKEEGGKPF